MKNKPKFRYAITIYNEHTGRDQPLGSTYATRNEAERYAKANICLRCNRYEIYSVNPNSTINPEYAARCQRKMGLGR